MTTERRRYYRIADRALIRYRVVPPEAFEAERRALSSHALTRANLDAALLDLDVRLQGVLASLRGVDRDVAEALDLLNRKLTLLGRVAALEGNTDSPADYREHAPADVSLSGGGVAMAAAEPLALHADLAIDLVLLPANHALRALGRVVECRPAPQAGFLLRVEFTAMGEADREALVQHVFRRQSAALRAARDEPSAPAAQH